MLIGRSKKAWLFLAVQDISKFNHVSPWPSNDKALLRGYHHGEATNRCVYWTLWTLTLLPLMLLKGYQDKRLLGRGFSRARTLVINSLIQRCGRAPAKCPNIVCWYRNKTTIFVFFFVLKHVETMHCAGHGFFRAQDTHPLMSWRGAFGMMIFTDEYALKGLGFQSLEVIYIIIYIYIQMLSYIDNVIIYL